MKKIAILSALVLVIGGLSSCSTTSSNTNAANGTNNRSTIGQYSSDALITSKIKAKYVKDLVLKSFAISVSTNQGVVSLVGNVSAEKYRQRAIHIAMHTKGVRAVDAKNLTVTTYKKHLHHYKHKSVQ